METNEKPTQKEKVLAFLKQRGPTGATSIEIANATGSLRFSARIMELRNEGHDIRGQREGASENGAEIWRYTYFDPDQFVDSLFEEPETKPDTAHFKEAA